MSTRRAPHPHPLCSTSLLALLASACAATLPDLPARAPDAAADPPELVLVWVGRGEAERWVDGAWVRAPELDYDFSVEQARHARAWSSTKSLRRRHPAYDGAAGPRAQTYAFELTLGPPDAAGVVPTTARTTLGDGVGRADVELREATLELRAAVSRLAPFDRYVITQRYRYEDGALDETVELRDGDRPYVRNVERATLFARHRFERAPTRAPAR